jgi:hypothetical protein
MALPRKAPSRRHFRSASLADNNEKQCTGRWGQPVCRLHPRRELASLALMLRSRAAQTQSAQAASRSMRGSVAGLRIVLPISSKPGVGAASSFETLASLAPQDEAEGASRRALGTSPERVAADAIRSSATLRCAARVNCLFTISNSAISFLPRRVVRQGSSRFLVAPWSLPTPTEGWRSAGRRTSLELRRAGKARRHACEAWAVPRNRDAASRRSTVALSSSTARPRHCRRSRREGHCGQTRSCLTAAPGFSDRRLRAARFDATSPLCLRDRLRRTPLHERG